MSDQHQVTRTPSLRTLILSGGGQDWTCTDCLPEARKERGDALVDVAACTDPTAYCCWCFVEASDV